MQTGQTKGARTDVARMIADSGLTERQQNFVYAYLHGSSKTEAAAIAGYEIGSAPAVFRHAGVQRAIGMAMDRFLTGELAPAAINVISTMLAAKDTPAGVKAQLALGVLDRAGFSAKRHEKTGDQAKDIGAMSSTELQAEIDKLSREIEGRMRDITPGGEPDSAPADTYLTDFP